MLIFRALSYYVRPTIALILSGSIHTERSGGDALNQQSNWAGLWGISAQTLGIWVQTSPDVSSGQLFKLFPVMWVSPAEARAVVEQRETIPVYLNSRPEEFVSITKQRSAKFSMVYYKTIDNWTTWFKNWIPINVSHYFKIIPPLICHKYPEQRL